MVKNYFKGIFPPTVNNFIEEMVNCSEMNREYLYASFISIVSGFIGNRLTVKVKEGWIEKPSLWIAIVGNSGIKKTPTVKALLKPVYELEMEYHNKYIAELSNYRDQLANGEKGIKKPKCKQIIVDDITIESLYEVMLNNPNGLFQYKDELVTLFTDASRYTSTSQESKYLSLYDSTSVRVNRKTNQESFLIKNVFLSILGGVQMPILKNIASKQRVANGFMSRVLFCCPDAPKYEVSDKEANSRVLSDYNCFIKSFPFYLPEGVEDSIQLIPTDEAKERYSNWRKSFLAERINSSEISDFEKSTLSKYAATCMRLSVIVEATNAVFNEKEPFDISLNSMEGAIKLMEYFYRNFKKVESELIEEEDSINPKEVSLLKDYIEYRDNGYKRREVIKELLNQGYNNAQISRALNIPKSTISGYR